MPLSFFDFLAQAGREPALLITALLTLAVLVVNGWTDAPNAIAGAVVTGALPFRRAVALAAVCNFLGVLCVTSVNASVADTIYSLASFGGGSRAALAALCAAMAAVVLWAALAWCFGIPTSESHALAAGVSGAAVALEGSFSCLRWDSWGKVLLGLLLSALAGFGAGRLAACRLRAVKASDRTLLGAQVPGAALAAFLHGAQDGQKFLGIFLLGTALARGQGGQSSPLIPLWLMALCAGFMALGRSWEGGGSSIGWAGRWSPWGPGRVWPPTWAASPACWGPPSWACPSPPLTPGPAPCWGWAPPGAAGWTGGWQGRSPWPGCSPSPAAGRWATGRPGCSWPSFNPSPARRIAYPGSSRTGGTLRRPAAVFRRKVCSPCCKH